jgi:hypothetical protein
MASPSIDHPRKRWPGFVVTYFAALTAMLLIYVVTERNYFADGKTDFAMLGYVAPRAALVAFLPAVLGTWLIPGKRLLQIALGVLSGPLIGWAAIKLMHIYGVLS